MRITERDKQVLLSLARYHLLNRRLVQQLAFPSDITGRITRRRLEMLSGNGYIRRHNMLVASRFEATPSPLYLLCHRGCSYLADECRDPRFLHKPTKLPNPNHLFHQLAVAEVRIALDEAVVGQDEITLVKSISEFDVVNDAERDTKEHFRLFTLIQNEPRITCSPDAAFVLRCNGRQLAHYVEVERGSTGSNQMIARKSPGYKLLAERGVYKKHFPEADDFRVLLLAPTARRRDTVRRAFRDADAAEVRSELWRFAAITEVSAQTFLSGAVFYVAAEQPPRSIGEL